MRPGFGRVDAALLGAYVLAAALGTWTSCLLFHDGAVYLAAAWLGDGWDLFYSQFPMRAVSTLFEFGPAWALRSIANLSSGAFMLAAHILYFAGPLALWLVLRAVEPHRVFSRLYLVITLPMIYFISEMIAGLGLWLIWFALLADPGRARTAKIVATLVIAPLLVFTHPGVGMFSFVLALVGAALLLIGRPFPRGLVVAAGLMGALLIASYFATSVVTGPTNSTIAPYLQINRHDYIDPRWMLTTFVLFPMVPAYWLLLLAPGLESTLARWSVPPRAVLLVATIGVWFAAAGTGLLLWLYARHTAPHALALALALALPSVAAWLVVARRPLLFCALIGAVAAVSYNVDLYLFGRFVDRQLRPGIIDVATLAEAWPPSISDRGVVRTYLKWAAAPDYVRDVVVPEQDWYRLALAFYSYFRSDRRSVIYHPLDRSGDWIPYECAAVARIAPRDDRDRAFVAFLAGHYCVR